MFAMLIRKLAWILANLYKLSDVCRLFNQSYILMYIDVAELYFEPYASDFVLFESLMLE